MMLSLAALILGLILGGIIGSLLTQRLLRQRDSNGSEEHQRSEVELRQSDIKLKRFIESNLIGVVVADANGTIFEANHAFLEMVGYTQDDLQAGKLNWAELTPPEYADLDRQAVEEQRTKGACLPFEKEYFRKDGSRVPVYIGCAIFDEPQQISIGFMLDLSARKQAEAAVRQSEAKFRRLIEANLIGVSIAHLDGPIFEANDAFLEMLGYRRDDLYANRLNWFELTPPEYFQIDRQATEEMRTTGTFTPFEKEYYRKDGSRIPVLIGHAVFDQAQQISIGFVLDLTDRKQAEMASVLAERNRIAREIHDTLGQAFTSIMVHLDVAARKLAGDQTTAQACIQTSYELAQLGLAEVRRSLAALRPRGEAKDLYSALSLLAKQMFAHSQVQLNCNRQGEPYPLPPANEHHLLRIGQEALMNACKHANASSIHLELNYDPIQCILRIQDNGIGFTLDGLSSNALQQFNGGFGLLSITERAESMGAQLTIQSIPGQGTEVVVVVRRDGVKQESVDESA